MGNPINFDLFFIFMHLIRLKISSSHNFLTRLQFHFIDVIIDLEILELFQYDQSNFLSLQKIRLKPEFLKDLEATMKKYFLAVWYQIMEQKDDEILCFMKQRADQGFWPTVLAKEFGQGFWSLIPPIQVNQNDVLLTVIATEFPGTNVLEKIENLADSVEILSQERIEEDMAVSSKSHGIPWSIFTPRQREIATYAVQQGYYQVPKKMISAAQIGEHFKISGAAVSEHLRKIEQKLMHFVFG